MEKETKAPFRDHEKWSYRITGPKKPTEKRAPMLNLAPFKEQEGPLRNEGSEYNRKKRQTKQRYKTLSDLVSKRGKP